MISIIFECIFEVIKMLGGDKMKKKYIISSVSNNAKVYFNNDYAKFMVKFPTYYTSKKSAKEALQYAKIH